MNWTRAVKIWWYWFWRAMLLTLIVGFLVGLLLGLVAVMIGIAEDNIRLLGNTVGGVIGLFFSVLILKSIPEKKFSDFTVVLIRRDSDPAQIET